LTAPAPEPPRPTLTAIAAPVSTIPGARAADDRTKLLVIAGATIAVLVSVIIVMALGGDKDEAEAKIAQAAASAKARAAEPEAVKPPEPEAQQGQPAGADSAAPGATAPAADAAKSKATTGTPATSTPSSGKVASGNKDKPGAKPEEDKVPVKDKPSDGVGSFNTSAAKSALASAANGANGCARPDGPVGTGQAVVTFAASGRVTTVNVGGAFGGTRVGSCVASLFRRARVPAFSGSPVTVSKRFSVSR
jgi:hypothetical protein